MEGQAEANRLSMHSKIKNAPFQTNTHQGMKITLIQTDRAFVCVCACVCAPVSEMKACMCIDSSWQELERSSKD